MRPPMSSAGVHWKVVGVALLMTGLCVQGATAAPSDPAGGTPYTLSCGVGAPLVVRGTVPATVEAGQSFSIEDVSLEYTNPIGPVTYTGTEVRIAAPAGTTGPDLVVTIPEAVSLDTGETYRSPSFSGTFVASAPVGSSIEFFPSALTIDSASTVGGGSLACGFESGASPFAVTTVVDGDLAAALSRRVSGIFAGGSRYVYADGATGGRCNAQATYDGRYHPEGHPRRTGTYHMDLCINVDLPNDAFTAEGTFRLGTIGRAVVSGTVAGVIDASAIPRADLLLSLTITGGSKRFDGATGSIGLGGTSAFDIRAQTTTDDGRLVATVLPRDG
jgi:hypothetical protein